MGEKSPKLLNLMVPKEKEGLVRKKKGSFIKIPDENRLDLQLGLPYNASVGKNKRAAPAPVVGWPPIRSFRKNNLAPRRTAEPVTTYQSKPMIEIPATENKGLFVKINMDGVPIGRKVDLSVHNCYDKLSSAVDTLFSGLLAAQKNSCAGEIEKKQEEQKPITGLLDGTGEYTLVYEDNEGDRMLVGDVPWHMFVSTVKRLRVLKSSDLPPVNRGTKQAKEMAEGASK